MPVRVVRGHKCQNSYVGKVYTYDGLYKVAMFFMLEIKVFSKLQLFICEVLILFILQVVDYWADKGVSGFTVYKFRLKRLEGQPPLTTKEVLIIIPHT